MEPCLWSLRKLFDSTPMEALRNLFSTLNGHNHWLCEEEREEGACRALIPQTPHAAWQWCQSQLRGLLMFANILISGFFSHCSWSKLFTGHVINLAVSTRLHTCKHVESGFNFRLCELLIAHWSSTGEFTLLLVAQFCISEEIHKGRSQICEAASDLDSVHTDQNFVHSCNRFCRCILVRQAVCSQSDLGKAFSNS